MTTVIASAGLAADAKVEEKERKFLGDIMSHDPGVRYQAWIRAGEMSSEIVPQLGHLLNADDPGIAKAADEALRVHVHRSTAEWDSEKRKSVMRALLGLVQGKFSRKTRVTALRHLSLVGDGEAVPSIAPLLSDESLREEAVYCLERISGVESTLALMDAVKGAPDEFKPRIIAALGHRRDKPAADLLASMMGSPDTAVAIAAIKALARIGTKVEGEFELPEFSQLSKRDKAAYVDSWLRYLDAQVEKGETAAAEKIYTYLLNNAEEEHYQCAAIVSLGKIQTPGAVSAIIPKLQSELNTVRTVAKQVLIAMKGDMVEQKLQEALPSAQGEHKSMLESILEARKSS